MQHIHELAFTKSPVPHLLLNPYSNRVAASNDRAHALLGMHREELTLISISKLFTHCFSELIVFTDEVISLGKAYSDSLSIQCRTSQDHSLRIEVQASLVSSAEGELIQFAFDSADAMQSLRDHSEAQHHYRSGLPKWKKVSRIFQEFERENRLILDAAGEGIYGVDENGLTTFLNPAAERMLEWDAEELFGKNMHYVIHSRHADGSHYHAKNCPIYRAFRDGVVNQVENEVFWTKSGKPIDVEYTSTPIRDGNETVGAVIIFRDVTEKKNSQKQLLDALNEVEHLKHRLEMENAYLQEEINSEFNHHQIVGKSAAIQNIIQRIELVAPTDVTVLIDGESGTGKELIARAIHEESGRRKRSLIRVNCAAIPESLFESEFFGHKKGAFTGATSDRPGRFELADGGSLFLDEVGEIPLPLQGKLLRVLQEQQFERVGDSVTRNVDVRIIAATNRDLKVLVEQGKFREDLFFRLNVFPVESVPLRQRVEDIPLLAQHFLQRASVRANKAGLKMSLRQIEILQNYHWPGNIRELENIIERQVILAQGDTLRFDELLTATTIDVKQAPLDSGELLTELDRKAQEKQAILSALKKAGGKVSGPNGAASLLGIKPTTLSSRIKKYRLTPSDFKLDLNPAV